MCKEVVIIGAGGHAKVICDIVIKSGDKVSGFLDDGISAGTVIMGYPVIGKTDEISSLNGKSFIIGIGNNNVRKKFAKQYPQIDFYTAVHPASVISSGVKIGKGTCVMAGSVINACAEISEHCIINSGSIVEHDCFVGKYSHVSPGAVLCGTVTVGKNVHIGAGATVKNNINICDDVVLGAGAVVVKDISKKGTYVGVPAKTINGDA